MRCRIPGRRIRHGRLDVPGTNELRQLERLLQHVGLAGELLAAAALLLPRAATAMRFGQAAEGTNAGSPILLPALVQAPTVACDASNPRDSLVAAVVAAIPHQAVGPRPGDLFLSTGAR